MMPVRANTPVLVPGLACPECGGRVQFEIVEWGEDGAPLSGTTECADEEVDDAFAEKHPCLECRWSGEVSERDGDAPEDSFDDPCEECGGTGIDGAHSYFQSDWQPVMDRAEAWAKLNLRVRKRDR